MLSETSSEFKKKFLLEFTKELIKNSHPDAFTELNIEIKKEEQEQIEKQIKEKITTPTKTFETKTIRPIIKNPRRIVRPVLRIPEPRLPPNLQYLRPTATNTQIDLGRLNPFVNDPAVISIECEGADQPLIVRVPQPKPTDIILSEEEISEVINKFSELSKIPVQEGIFNVVVGKLKISAIISDTISSKFIIGKMRMGG